MNGCFFRFIFYFGVCVFAAEVAGRGSGGGAGAGVRVGGGVVVFYEDIAVVKFGEVVVSGSVSIFSFWCFSLGLGIFVFCR